MKAIENFINSQAYSEWLNCGEWVPAGEVVVGIPTKRYLDTIGFDACKVYKLNETSKVEHGPDTLSVSIVNNPKWGSQYT